MVRRSRVQRTSYKTSGMSSFSLGLIRKLFLDFRDDRNTGDISDFRSCYRLNLGEALVEEDDFSNDARDTEEKGLQTPLQVAIETAKIFNGIVVERDGTLVSQNERANKDHSHFLGRILEEGQSRQAVRIEKLATCAQDRFTPAERVLTKGLPLSTTGKSEQLVVLGQYDNIDHLVSMGAEKLRGAKSLCWLPPSILNRIIGFSSFQDAVSLSLISKLMHHTMKNSPGFQKQAKRLRKEKDQKRNKAMLGKSKVWTERHTKSGVKAVKFNKLFSTKRSRRRGN